MCTRTQAREQLRQEASEEQLRNLAAALGSMKLPLAGAKKAEQLQHAPDDVADRQFWRDKGPREGGQEGRRAGEGG